MTDTTGTSKPPEILSRAPSGRVVLWAGEVATLAGVTTMTVHRWARSGRLPVASTTGGGNRRYSFAAVAALLADLGRPVPWWLNGAAQAVAEAARGDNLEELALYLDRVAEWLEEESTARHSEDMAAGVRRASQIIYDLAFMPGGET